MRHVLNIGRWSAVALLAAGPALAQKAAEQKPAAAPPAQAQAAKPAAPAAGKVAAPKIEIGQETKDMGRSPRGRSSRRISSFATAAART